MASTYNKAGFYLNIATISLALYALYTNIHNMWIVAPPNYILLILSSAAFVMAVKGLKDKRNWLIITRSWFTLITSAVTTTLLALLVLLTLMLYSINAHRFLESTESPNGSYTVDFYLFDAGAAGTFGIWGELNGPLWFKKKVYYEKRTMEAIYEWKDDSTITINGRTLNLKLGETYGY